MLRALYDRTMGLAGHRHANWALAGVSFVESSVFPIPPDVVLIPMVLARRDKAWLIAAICTVSSVLGGLLGYAIGYFLFDAVGQPILEFYGYGEKFADFQSRYNEWGAWIV
ncbi:MAG: DedA family protein, partial [Alphaproteobacteria bacterium]|nr:DedA family protein [Alphaproteobacteria bacterium]